MDYSDDSRDRGFLAGLALDATLLQQAALGGDRDGGAAVALRMIHQPELLLEGILQDLRKVDSRLL